MAALTIKVSKTISNIQGNYSNTDNLMIMDSIYGKVALMYKGNLPAHMNKRFGGLRMDMSTGGNYKRQIQSYGETSGSFWYIWKCDSSFHVWPTNSSYNRWWNIPWEILFINI